ncbi:MAG TPA: archease [Candidatus Binataceae bacterium]|nr:archease [Candidatus Binataceae bacterium]
MAPADLYREIEHTGDTGIEIEAISRADLFAKAILSLARLMVDEAGIEPRENRKIEAAADSDADLMHDILSAALNLFLADGYIWQAVTVEERGNSIAATLFGEPFDRKRHQLLTEIKAVTYHQLSVECVKGGWHARIIFDI